MSKLLKLMVTSMLLLFIFPMTAFASITVLVDGTPLDSSSESIVHSGKLMVPMRDIFESLGAQVGYDNGSITAKLDKTEIKLTVNKVQCQINNKPEILPVAPIIYKNKTMVPLRFVSQAFDADVDYLNEHELVFITSFTFKNGLKSDNNDQISKVKKYNNYKNLTMTNEKSISQYRSVKEALQKNIEELKKYNSQIKDLVLNNEAKALTVAGIQQDNINSLQSQIDKVIEVLSRDTLTNQLGKDLETYYKLLSYTYNIIVEEKKISSIAIEKMNATLTAEQLVTSDIIKIENKVDSNINIARKGLN